MAQIKTDGDRWKVRLGEDRPRPGVRVVLFFCESNGQRPYRVAEVPANSYTSQDDLEKLTTEQLQELYRASHSLDFPRLRSDETSDVRREG
jgi:hypothetical protein